MTSTACDDQFAPDPSSREAAIEAMVMEVQPHEWRQGGAMRYQGHLITWGEYVQARNREQEAPEWSGEGLPPVGCECECWHTGSHQGVVTVRYMGSEMCVLLNHDHGEEQCGPIDAYSFRTIRSEEDRLVEQALKDISAEPDEYGADSVVYRMIKAGYRKTGGDA